MARNKGHGGKAWAQLVINGILILLNYNAL